MSILYETDFNKWIEETAQNLKDGDFQSLDLTNLIEEIESMGSNNKREIKSRLIVLLMHLLKCKYQPKKQTKSWVSTINSQRNEIELVLEDSPSLRPYLTVQIADCYQKARLDAATETKLPLKTFPLECPFTQEQILTAGWFPFSE
ncbi:MAG: DUF29 domain-containing protein [Microcystaceae cyanobacterium]